MSSTIYCSAEESEDLIMSQKASATMCCFTDESKDLIMSQRMNATICRFADESVNLIISQKMSAIMYHSADENDVNEAINCSVVKQNNSNTAINAIFEVIKTHKFFNLKFFNNTLIFNDITILSLTDYTNYFFKNLIQLICKQQKMNNLIITV
jgi:hypothetical protein